LALMLVAAVSVSAADITNFKAVNMQGDAKIQIPGGQIVDVELNKDYPFGSTVQTGRNSFLDLELSEGNTFRLLARTKLVVGEDAKNPKLKQLKLETGSVNVKLDNYPKDHKLQVETPTAVCGAVGTRFIVEFESDENETIAAQKAGGRENRFTCDKGEVFVASRFSVKDEEVQGESMDVGNVTAGSQMVAVIHEGEENTYTDIPVNRGKLTFDYGGEKGNELTVEPKDNQPTRFVCALEKKSSDTQLAALDVKSGEVVSVKRSKPLFGQEKVEETAVTPADGAVVLSKNEVFTPKQGDTTVDDYIASTETEGELHSEITDMERAGEAVPEAKRKDLQAATDKATTLRKQLVSRNIQRMIRTVNRNSRPPSVPHH
jgi:hypothetical protein